MSQGLTEEEVDALLERINLQDVVTFEASPIWQIMMSDVHERKQRFIEMASQFSYDALNAGSYQIDPLKETALKAAQMELAFIETLPSLLKQSIIERAELKKKEGENNG